MSDPLDPLPPRDSIDAGAALPPRRPLEGAFDALVRGWRPFAGWACGATILVRGAAVPAVELARGVPVSPMDWVSLIALAGVLGIGAMRTVEKREGLTS